MSAQPIIQIEMDELGLEPNLTCETSTVYLLVEFEPLTMAIFNYFFLPEVFQTAFSVLCTKHRLTFNPSLTVKALGLTLSPSQKRIIKVWWCCFYTAAFPYFPCGERLFLATHKFWWTQRDSNPRPLACKASALPIELWAQAKTFSIQFLSHTLCIICLIYRLNTICWCSSRMKM